MRNFLSSKRKATKKQNGQTGWESRVSRSRWVRVLCIGGNYALLTLGDESWETAYCSPSPCPRCPPFGNSLTWPLWGQLKSQRKASRRGAVVGLGHGWRSLCALLWLKANSLNGTAKQSSKGAGGGGSKHAWKSIMEKKDNTHWSWPSRAEVTPSRRRHTTRRRRCTRAPSAVAAVAAAVAAAGCAAAYAAAAVSAAKISLYKTCAPHNGQQSQTRQPLELSSKLPPTPPPPRCLEPCKKDEPTN